MGTTARAGTSSVRAERPVGMLERRSAGAARGTAALLAAVLGASALFGGEPTVLRFTYLSQGTAGPAPALYTGSALTVEAQVFRMNAYYNGGGPAYFILPFTSEYGYVVYLTASQNELGEFLNLAFKPGAGGCCVQIAAQSTAVPMRAWTHLAATLDGTTARLYLGGVEIANGAIDAMPFTTDVGALSVGHGFPGAIRDVRVWSRALSAAEIAASAAGGMPDATGLVADWALDDGTGQEAADGGPNGIPLTLGSSTAVEAVDPNWIPAALLEEGPYFEGTRSARVTPLEAWFEPMPVDASGDGLLDMFFVGGLTCERMTCTEPYYEGDPPAQLLPLRSNGDGTFTEDAALVEYEGLAGGFRYVPGDYTGDGRTDVFVIDSGPEPWVGCGIDCPPAGIASEDWPGGRSRLFVGTAGGVLVEESTARLPDRFTFAHYGAAGDVDGDGDRDIFLGARCHPDCAAADFAPGDECPVILINDGTGHFVEDFDRLPLTITTCLDGLGNEVRYQASAMLDAEGDGDVDLYLAGPGGANLEFADVLLLNDGTGHLVRAPATALPDRPGGVADGGNNTRTADLNRDGADDIITTQSFRLAQYWANGNGTFRDGAPQIHGLPLTYDLCHPTDLNADGWLDLACVGGAAPRFFYNLANENFALMPLDYDFGPTYEGAPGLVDGDEMVDVLIGGSGETLLIRQVKPYFPPGAVGIFAHGFESEDTARWSNP
jgi:hypothetical protein